MRLEFASNSGSIGWSVKRTNESENYKQNDTDLSFVTEKWINGREGKPKWQSKEVELPQTEFEAN